VILEMPGIHVCLISRRTTSDEAVRPIARNTLLIDQPISRQIREFKGLSIKWLKRAKGKEAGLDKLQGRRATGRLRTLPAHKTDAVKNYVVSEVGRQ
jgi:hypothetical protein